MTSTPACGRLPPHHQGDFANAQIAAIMERLDTDQFRVMELDLMSS